MSIRQIENIRSSTSSSVHEFVHGVVTLVISSTTVERFKLLAQTHTHLHNIQTILLLKQYHFIFYVHTTLNRALEKREYLMIIRDNVC